MSVLIQGMEMPTSCSVCEVTHRMHHGELVCRLLNVYASEVDMEEECPLIDVPLHGRLIDADKFYKEIKRLFVGFYTAYERDKKDERIAALLELDIAVRRLVGDAPTIIPADKED